MSLAIDTSRDARGVRSAGARRSLVLIAGIDPVMHAGGHQSYVIAHGLAASVAGFQPHVFCVSSSARAEMTEFGHLHRVRAPLADVYRAGVIHQRSLVAAVTEYVTGLDGPGACLLHSFGAWAATGVAAARQLEARSIPAIPIASAYTLLHHENAAKLAALRRHHGPRLACAYARDYLWVRAVADRAERRGYQQSRLVLTNYESVRELLTGACGPWLPIRTIPYAAPSAFREPHHRGRPPAVLAGIEPADAPLIVAVSRQDARKGIDTLLFALAELQRHGTRFRACLVGGGRMLEKHRQLVRRLGLAASVALPGRVDDVFDYLAPADIFVLPSHEEGSGSVSLLEAIQASTAIVAARCDGIPEDLSDGSDALLVEPGDAGDLARALEVLLADQALRSRFGARARDLYERRFSAATFADALGGLYRELFAAAMTQGGRR